MKVKYLFILILCVSVIMSANVIFAADADLNGTVSDGLMDQSNNELNSFLDDSNIEENSDEILTEENDFHIIYISSNASSDGNGSYEKPYSTFQEACDNVNDENNTIINLFEGTYYIGSELKFKTNNLIVNGLGDNVIIKNEFNTRKVKQALELYSASANFTLNNVIFDATGWTLTNSHTGRTATFFHPFYGTANYVTYKNCTFIANSKLTLDGSDNQNVIFDNCIFKNFTSFFTGKLIGEKFIVIKNSIFLSPSLAEFTGNIKHNDKNITFNKIWFGENELPDWLVMHAYNPDGTPASEDFIPVVEQYAIFNVTGRYLGNNQYEIIGKLCWNGTDETVGDTFAPMTVTLNSTTGDIIPNATLENGIFRAVYTSNSSNNKVTATLDYQPIELKFTNVDIQVDAPNIYYGDDQNITVTLPQAMNATISITVNNKTYEVKTNNISTTYTIDDIILTEGEYEVNVTLEALVDEVHIHGINSTQLIVSKVSDYTFNPIVPSQEVRAGYNAVISIELPDDATGVITISVEDGNASSYLVNGSLDVDVLISKVGDNKIIINYTDDNKYASDSKEVHISAYNETPTIEITIPTDVKVGDAVDIGITLPDDATGIVLVTVGENKYFEELTDGETTIKVPTVSENTTVAVKYLGDGRYVESTANATLEVTEKVDANIKIEVPKDVKIGDVVVINVTADSDAVLDVLINGETQKVVDGTVTYTVNAVDTYTIIVEANETAEYKKDVKVETFNASKLNTTVSANPILFEEGNSSTIEISIPNIESGIILVDVADQKFYGDINAGTATVLINGLVAGNYTADIIFAGDEKFNKATGTVTVNVTAAPDIIGELEEIISNLTDTVKSQNSTIESQAKEISNLTDTVKSQNSTIESQAKEISNLTDTVKSQNSTIETQKEQINNLTTKKDTILVVDKTFTCAAVDTGAGEKGGMFYAILKDSDNNVLANKTVQIAINGEIYNKTTDNEGKAGIQVNFANANTYTYAISFQGDDKYNAAPMASSKLTVTKKKTTIKATNKVFKAKTKTKKISVTLKTVKNQYDKKTYLKSGKKVTLKVNGKTYTAKINKKGVAKFTIKITKKGKYTAKIKFAGDKTYKASSKTIKIRIK